MLRPLSRRVVACYVSSASTSDARFQRFPVSGRHLSQFVIPSVPRNLEIKRVPRPCLSAFWSDRAGGVAPRPCPKEGAFGRQSVLERGLWEGHGLQRAVMPQIKTGL